MYKRLWMSGLALTILIGYMMTHYADAANEQPRIMVTGYELAGGGLGQGKSNELTLKLKNMNTTYPVYSVLVTFVSPDPHVHTKYGSSSQAYIDSIPPGKEREAVIPLEVTDGLEAGYLNSVIGISWQDDAKGVTSSSDSVINIPVLQDYLKILRVYIPETIGLNVKSRVSVTFKNIKSEEIYNTVMTIKGSGMKDTSAELGTVFSGSRKNQEIYISFSTTGPQNISVAFSYSDAKGNKYTTQTQNYQVEVVPRTAEGPDTPADSNEATLFNLTFNKARIMQFGYIFAILLCLTGAVVEIRRERSA